VRPVNLIPQDARRGDRAAMRTGSFSYVLLGGLAVALLAVIALALTSKQISDKESEVTRLEQEEQQVTARAQSLQAFADFRAMQESRSATVASLAQSRFDWQRVLNELARVIPPGVSLSQLAGTVRPGITPESAPSITMRASIQGPALEMVGCAPSQDAVAGLISNLEEIDGVTRVGMQSAGRQESSSDAATGSATTSGSADGSTGNCPASFMSFEIVVAFDAVPPPATATSVPSVPSSLAASGSQAASQTAATSSGGG
jgi:Tfp pilus assembly protein PilN